MRGDGLLQCSRECLKKKKALPLCSAEDSFIDMEIINKIILSAKSGSKEKKIKFKKV